MTTTVRLLTKKDLCRIFGEYSPKSFRMYYHRLKERYFTPEALEELEISPEEFEKVGNGKPFTFAQTRRIIAYFDIKPDELNQ